MPLASWIRLKGGAGIFRPCADVRKTKDVLIVAGEASADLHGSNLVRAIKGLDHTVSFYGIGGKQMEEAGVKILIPASDMAVVGLTEVFSKLPKILRAHRTLRNLLKKSPPDLLIPIDYPGFNIHLAGVAKRYKIPVLYYISPQVWAWRTGRVKKIAKRVDRMAVILPFEERFYRKRGVEVDYVGHPLLDSIPQHLDKDEMTRKMGLENAYPVLGILPGSRNEEIRNHLPVMVKAAEILSSQYPRLIGLLPVAPTIQPDLVQSFLKQSPAEISISQRSIYDTLIACDLALVASGTATVETAILGVPMILVYRASAVTFWVGKRVIKVPFLGLVNLVAGEQVIPELIQDHVTPDRLAREAIEILEGGQKRENMIEKLGMVKQRLGRGGASERTAKIALEMLNRF
jgi:lipid-A-disaccharide synthase